MSPFAYLVSHVTAPQRQAPAPRINRPSVDFNKSDVMRRHLGRHGEADASELAKVAGLKNTGLVYALLKWDIGKGRIQRFGKRYRLADMQER